MMLDRIEARLWADHHHAFGDWVASAAASVGEAFRALHRQRFAAPWRRPDR